MNNPSDISVALGSLAFTAAEAQAEANVKLARSLTPELVELKRLERWNGALPQVAGSANPFVTLNTTTTK